jgi:hypothetical protein
VTHASSTRKAEINWKIHDGQYRVAVMNTDGHAGFATTTAIGITTPNIAIYAIAGLVLGLLVAGGGTRPADPRHKAIPYQRERLQPDNAPSSSAHPLKQPRNP